MSEAGAIRRLPWSHALLVAATTMAVVMYVYVWIALPLSTGRALSGGFDFQAYHRAARHLRAGEELYNLSDRSWTHPDAKRGMPYLYPPLLAGLLSPLSDDSREAATNKWAVINYLLLVPIVTLLALISSPLPRVVVACTSALLLAFCLPLGFTLELGQANVVVLFLLVAGWLAWERERPHLAAIALLAATMIKLTPVVPLVFVCRQRPRVAVTVGVCALALSALFAQPTLGFLRTLPMIANPQQNLNATNQSLPAFIDRLFVPNPRVDGIADAPVLAAILGIVGRVMLLSVFVWVCRRPARSPAQFQLGFGLAILISLLLPRVVWVHHHVACVIPALAALNALALVPRRSLRVVGGVTLLLATTLVSLPPVWLLESVYHAWRHTAGGALWVAYPFYGTLALLGLCAWLYFRDDESVEKEVGFKVVTQHGISENATAPAATH